jgi:hypothetical protein
LAGRGVLSGRGRTREATLHLALRRTTIAIHQVSIIAVFAGGIEVAVAASRGAGLGLARAILTGWFFGTGLGAAFAVTVEETVHGLATARKLTRIRAAVAQLALFDDAVTALGDVAGLPWRGTVGTGLNLAGAGAAVAACGVAIVALLPAVQLAVTAQGRAMLARHAALIALLNRFAIRGAAVAAGSVAVIAGFVRGHHAVATDPDVRTRLARVFAKEARFQLAKLVAAVATVGVAVIARFAVGRIEHAIAAILRVDAGGVGSASARADDDAATTRVAAPALPALVATTSVVDGPAPLAAEPTQDQKQSQQEGRQACRAR